MNNLFRFGFIGLSLLLWGLILTAKSTIAAPISVNNQQISTTNNCNEPLTTLVPALMKDIPSYGNRVISRSRRVNSTEKENPFGTIVEVSEPDLRPIPLVNRQFTPTVQDTTEQFFFTSIERQYLNNKSIMLQHYHLVFLTPTQQGWRLVQVFSRMGKVDQTSGMTPFMETTDGVIGKTIELWLRDHTSQCPNPV